MRHKKFITLTTEQDIETACQRMDRQERDVLLELGDGIPECDEDERAMVLQARSGRFEDGW